MSTKRGSVARARATPSRRSSPCDEDDAGWSAYSASPSSASSSFARLVASRREAPTPSAETSTFSRTVRPRNAWLCWKVRASPCRPRRMRRPAGHVPVARAARGLLVGPVEAAEHVDERRLAGPVRARSARRPRPAAARARRHAAPRRPRTNGRRRRPGAILRASLASRSERPPPSPTESGLFGTFFARIMPFSIGVVVVDLDHAVRATEDRVQLLREAHLARDRRHVVELLHHSRELRADERAVCPLDRRDDAVDRSRAGDEPAGRGLWIHRLRELVHGLARVVAERVRVRHEPVVRDLRVEAADPVRSVTGPRVEHRRLVRPPSAGR